MERQKVKTLNDNRTIIKDNMATTKKIARYIKKFTKLFWTNFLLKNFRILSLKKKKLFALVSNKMKWQNGNRVQKDQHLVFRNLFLNGSAGNL